MRPQRKTRYAIAHDMDSWKADPRIAARGFSHQWDSVVADGNGEDFFLQLLGDHLTSEMDVLDVGCGHGELSLWVARQVRSVTAIERHGYDRLAGDTVPRWDEAAAEAEAAYANNQDGGALVLRHVRLVWAVRLP